MLRFCVNQWDKHKDDLEAAIRQKLPVAFPSYRDLVALIVEYVLNDYNKSQWPVQNHRWHQWDYHNIIETGYADYQGTIVFLIPSMDPSAPESAYLLTAVNYGSCSGCDALLAIEDDPDHERQIRDLMTLCLHLVQNIVRPYYQDDNEWHDDMKRGSDRT